VEQTKA